MSRRNIWSLRIAMLTVVLSCLVSSDREARACGMFVPRDLTETIPTIRQEQVLLIYDAARQQQHFVREVNFDAGSSEFGFIVPTPSKPEVAKATSPFKALRAAYPFEPPRPKGGGGPPGSRGLGASGGEGAAPAVSVLSVQRVGKFTAFVLAATQAEALEKWLSDNRFQVPPQSRDWLDHYVALSFYYVAFRYDPPNNDKQRGLTSETVRISFPTPVPYYPYQEPSSARRVDSRLLSLWFVSTQPMLPVAAHSRLGMAQHARPWRAGLRYDVTTAALGAKLGTLRALLPATKDKLTLQTFRDLKRDRGGWGDVLLVPQQPRTLSSSEVQNLRRFFPVLDPSLLEQR